LIITISEILVALMEHTLLVFNRGLNLV